MAISIAFIIGSYLLGSLPQVYLLGRLKGFDLRREQDLHLALWRKASRGLGLMGVLGDLAKGPIPVLGARALGMEDWVVALSGLMVVLGQMWPAYFLSSGGRGNSVTITMSLALATHPFLFALIPIVLGIALRMVPRLLRHQPPLGEPPSHSVPLGMALGFAIAPVAAWLMGEPREVVWVLVAVFVAIMVRRLTAGLGAELAAAPRKWPVLLHHFLFD